LKKYVLISFILSLVFILLCFLSLDSNKSRYSKAQKKKKKLLLIEVFTRELRNYSPLSAYLWLLYLNYVTLENAKRKKEKKKKKKKKK